MLSKKLCPRCGIILPLDSFNRYSRSPDGAQPYCRSCQAEYMSTYLTPEVRRENWRADYETSPARFKEYAHRSRQKNKVTYEQKDNRRKGMPGYIAKTLVAHAIESGKLQKPKACSFCAKEVPTRLLHAHHQDYTKPLKVIWLCSTCHGLTWRKV